MTSSTLIFCRKDAFQRREAAHEGLYIRQRELEKYVAQNGRDGRYVLILVRIALLRLKLKEQRKHMDELDKHLYVALGHAGYFVLL